MAGATVYLARYTHKLAKDAAEGIKQAERHHQEILRPFCVIDFNYATIQDPFGIDEKGNPRLADAHFSLSEEPPPRGTIFIRGELHNKGKGLAKDVVIYLNMRRGIGEEHAYRLTRPVVVSGLIGAEDDLKIDIAVTERDIIPTWDGSKWQPVQTIDGVKWDIYEIVLEYKDVFNNTFRTVHPRGIWHDPLAEIAATGDQGKRQELMIRWDRPTPIFLTGRQAARTPADFPYVPQVSDAPTDKTGTF
jgi:hypothetical protein